MPCPLVPDPVALHIAGHIRRTRERRGMTQAELGRLSNLDRASVHRWENAEGHLRAGALMAIAQALDIPLDDFTPPALRMRAQAHG